MLIFTFNDSIVIIVYISMHFIEDVDADFIACMQQYLGSFTKAVEQLYLLLTAAIAAVK